MSMPRYVSLPCGPIMSQIAELAATTSSSPPFVAGMRLSIGRRPDNSARQRDGLRQRTDEDGDRWRRRFHFECARRISAGLDLVADRDPQAGLAGQTQRRLVARR